VLARWACAYGTRLGTMLAHCRTPADLGEEIVPGLFEIEADYLVRHEWALDAEDILWRRSKLGLHLPGGAAARLDAWLALRRAGQRRGSVTVS
jgi:glycerol-3-phosphate dehydrogenase